MRGNYQKPSDLLKQQKESGLSYWDLIGRPLYGNPTQETPGFTIAENYPGYEGGKDDYKLTPSLKKTIAQMYKRLRAAGFDDNSIAGIIGNSIQESGINPNLSSTNKMYHGLFQNSSKLRDKIAALYGDHSMNNLLLYVIDWTNKDKRIMGKAYAPYMATGAGKYKKTGYKTAEEAAEAFMKLYERPVILDKKGNVVGYQEHGKRKAYGKQMGTYLRTTYPQKGKPTTFMLTEPEEVELPMPVTPTPQYTYDAPMQQVAPQVLPQVNTLVENNPYELFMAEKQVQQDAFNLAMNNVYSKLPHPSERLGQFGIFDGGKDDAEKPRPEKPTKSRYVRSNDGKLMAEEIYGDDTTYVIREPGLRNRFFNSAAVNSKLPLGFEQMRNWDNPEYRKNNRRKYNNFKKQFYDVLNSTGYEYTAPRTHLLEIFPSYALDNVMRSLPKHNYGKSLTPVMYY